MTTTTSRRFVPTPERARDLRRAFGCFGTGVTIISTETPEGPLGMTANSFSSISLDPALVLWSPAKSSQRHDAFVQAAHFCIHVLGANQLTLAKHFATNGTDFTPFDWTAGPGGAPTLKGSLAEFHCDTYAVHPAGDHSLILGEVRHVVQHDSDHTGLLFDQGRFGHFSASPVAGQ
ncbi:flavin reductase family protein [Roseobacter weihaiensis]|uniref:flavin reductase family protein n=1 Tax=Roseobacter weihaiensis TaxID=2763262 RepID=UPI001D099F62|nr:flavin reductase family protein [Roseobacter sp. H9]